MSNKILLHTINTQDQIKSLPLRENYQSIENSINHIYSILDELSTKNTNSNEIIMAREGETSLLKSLQKRSSLLSNAIFAEDIIETSDNPSVYKSENEFHRVEKYIDTINSMLAIIKNEDTTNEATFKIEHIDTLNLEKSQVFILLNISPSVINKVESISLDIANNNNYTEYERYSYIPKKNNYVQKCIWDIKNNNQNIDISKINTLRLVIKLTENSVINKGELLFDKITTLNSAGTISISDNNKLTINKGSAISTGKIISWKTSLSDSIIFPEVNNYKISTICVGTDGLIKLVEGEEKTEFTYPPYIPSSYIHLADIYLRGGTSKINYEDDGINSFLIDRRNISSGSSSSYNFQVDSSLSEVDNGMSIIDASANISNNKPTLLIERPNSASGIAFAIGDNFQVKGDGRVKMTGFRGVSTLTHFTITQEYGTGIVIPSNVDPEAKHISCHIQTTLWVEFPMGVTICIMTSYDKGVTEQELAYVSPIGLYNNAVAVEGFSLLLPIVDGKTWVRYVKKDILLDENQYEFEVTRAYINGYTYI